MCICPHNIQLVQHKVGNCSVYCVECGHCEYYVNTRSRPKVHQKAHHERLPLLYQTKNKIGRQWILRGCQQPSKLFLELNILWSIRKSPFKYSAWIRVLNFRRTRSFHFIRNRWHSMHLKYLHNMLWKLQDQQTCYSISPYNCKIWWIYNQANKNDNKIIVFRGGWKVCLP